MDMVGDRWWSGIFQLYEILEKGNTRTRIPKRPATAPAAHIHSGTSARVSRNVHADSGIESAESILAV